KRNLCGQAFELQRAGRFLGRGIGRIVVADCLAVAVLGPSRSDITMAEEAFVAGGEIRHRLADVVGTPSGGFKLLGECHTRKERKGSSGDQAGGLTQRHKGTEEIMK